MLNTSERKHTHCPWKLSLLPTFPTLANGTTIYTPKGTIWKPENQLPSLISVACYII